MESFSVGESQPEMIGLPGVLGLCILDTHKPVYQWRAYEII